MNVRPNVPDILNFEKKFHEIICEVERNTKELDNLEKERLLLREELCSKESLLRNERKISNELQARLKMASEAINRLEEEKMREKIEYSNLSLSYECLLKERDALTRETLTSQTEAAKLRIKIESLENALQREIRQKQKLMESLRNFKTANEKIIANIDMSIAKISDEQKYLLETAKGVIQLNRRLQTFGLCFHAINERNKAQIKSLQQKLISLSMNEMKQSPNHGKLHPEMENLCLKLKKMLMDLKSKLQDPTPFEETLSRILNEISTNLPKSVDQTNN